MERRLAALWAELFAVPEVGLDDNVLELGGHSLLLLRAHARLRDELGVAPPIVALLQYPTVRTLARHLSGEDPAEAQVDVRDRARRAREALARQRGARARR